MAEYIAGIPLRYNVGTQDSYVNRLRGLVDPMLEETEEEVNSLFSAFLAGALTLTALSSRVRITLNKLERKHGKIFAKDADKITARYARDLDALSRVGVKRNLKKLLPGVKYKPRNPAVDASLKNSENALDLMIEGVPSFYFAKVKREAFKAVAAGDDTNINEFLINQRRITRNKTARDFIGTFRDNFNSVCREKLKLNGLSKWQWVHTDRANEPRPYHQDGLNGLVFDYDSPPPIIDQKTGETGYPGQLWGCQCIMLPVRELV